MIFTGSHLVSVHKVAAVGSSDSVNGDISVKTPSRHSKGSGELVRQHCPPGHENKSNDPPRPNLLPVRWRLQLYATAASMHRDPLAWHRMQCVRRLKSRGKEHLSPVRRSCEDQR